MTVKKVQFSSKIILVDTYSSDEYDRSGIYSTPVLYKVNPTIKPLLTLTIQSTTSLLPELDTEDISSADLSPDTPDNDTQDLFEFKKKKKRPILSVNTSMCADPLFFTKLSTNYTKFNTPIDNDYLVPISASIVRQNLF